ncbi:MAG: GntR family transcriptional regulator [Micromonosporaceae bacterium]|nr:GntR family transcriptional regulator [Micromonosporaceae bacterium]
MLLRLDPSAEEPLFAQLVAQLRLAIAAGQLRGGERLPAARDLAESLDVNSHTVLRAYQELRDDGLIELRRGRGAVVASGAGRDHRALLKAIDVVVREARALGLSPQATAALLKEAFRT